MGERWGLRKGEGEDVDGEVRVCVFMYRVSGRYKRIRGRRLRDARRRGKKGQVSTMRNYREGSRGGVNEDQA